MDESFYKGETIPEINQICQYVTRKGVLIRQCDRIRTKFVISKNKISPAT